MSGSAPELRWLGRVDRWGRSHQWVSDAVVALVALVVLGGLSRSGAQGIHWSAGWAAGLIVGFVVLHVSVALRNRAPEVAYAAGARPCW